MIPKIIHYCWFGGKPFPELTQKCIASWHRYMPDWHYMCWDESNFEIASAPLYVRQAYEARKFAFVSDYVRLWALEQYGGVYFDTDVEVVKSFEPLLGDMAFIGMEESKAHLVGTCVMGCEAHCRWVKDMLSLYKDLLFIKQDGSFDLTTNVQRLGQRMIAKGLNQPQSLSDREPWHHEQYIAEWGLRVYTHDYFSPITSTRVIRKTNNTYSIHYYLASWVDRTYAQRIKDWIIAHVIGRKLTDNIAYWKRQFMSNHDDYICESIENPSHVEVIKRIPHVIHYCWFGGNPLPELVEQCIASWHQHMPDYEYKCWDESTFDISSAPLYVRQAYEARKYAFVSDYVRLWALEQYGGLYMDVDFEVLRPFDDIMDRYIAFAGYEGSKRQPVMMGVIASEPHGMWVRDMLATYNNRPFIKPDGNMDFTPNTTYFSNRLEEFGAVLDGVEKDVIINGFLLFHVFPVWAFCPILTTGENVQTPQTYCIHRGLRSWTADDGWKYRVLFAFSPKIRIYIIKIKRVIFG